MSLVTGRALILARLWNLVEPKMDVFSTFSVKKKKKGDVFGCWKTASCESVTLEQAHI